MKVANRTKCRNVFFFRALLMFVLVSNIVSCGDASKVEPTVTTLNPNADKPSVTSFNTGMNFSSDGKLRARLHAGRVRSYDAQRVTILDSNVKIDFYNAEGQHSSVLTSIHARVNDMNKNMAAYQSVHIVSDSGTVVDTDTLEWDNQRQILHSDAAVRIIERNGRVTSGIGFESDPNLTHYHIHRPTIVAPGDAFGNAMGSGDQHTSASPRSNPALTPGALGAPNPFGASPDKSSSPFQSTTPTVQKPDTTKH
ncbi:MAG: LPS export ABC transporter periplasmic protein LptC [Candidatus Kapaibacterium sp.]